jgi:hypothetical protein
MSQHSLFPNCKDKDLIRLTPEQILEFSRFKERINCQLDKYFGDANCELSKFLGSCTPPISVPTKITREIDSSRQEHINNWVLGGIDCEVLHLGSPDWKKGKVKIKVSVEFIPDEDEKIKDPATDIEVVTDELEQIRSQMKIESVLNS